MERELEMEKPEMEELVESGESMDEFVAVDETETDNANADPEFVEQMKKQHQIQMEMPPKFQYTYESTEGLKQEIDDWFDYKDNWMLEKSKQVFEQRIKSWNSGAWTSMTSKQKASFVDDLIRSCALPSDISNEAALRDVVGSLYCLCYITQGAFGDVTSLDGHLEAIRANCDLVKPHFASIYTLMRQCLDIKCPDALDATADAADGGGTADVGGSPEMLDLILKNALTIVYFILETSQGDLDFALALSKLPGLPILSYFVDLFGRFRWLDVPVDTVVPLNKLLMILWKAILCLFGNHKDLLRAKRYVRTQNGLPDDEEEFSSHVDIITASPLDYHAFRADIISRYPSYIPPQSFIPKELEAAESLSQYIEVARPSHAQVSNKVLPAPVAHIATPAPSPPLSPAIMTGQKVKKSLFMTNQSFPFLFPSSENVPKSIVEAGELFASRVRMTPAMRQLWHERDFFMKAERGWSDNTDDFLDGSSGLSNGYSGLANEQDGEFKGIPERLEAVEAFYKDCHPRLNYLTNVILREILHNSLFMQAGFRNSTEMNDSFNESGNTSPKSASSGGIELDPVTVREKDIAVKACSAILELLTNWFKTSHILKFEYLSALLFDSRYYLVVYKHLYGIPLLEKVLNIPDSLKLNFFSVCKGLSKGSSNDNYGQTACRTAPLINRQTAETLAIVEPYSQRVLFTIINLTKVLKRIVKRKVQRLVMVAELPSDILKKTLSLYQEDLWRTVLEIFKEQVPYHGKKWKFNNMDIISFIYLYCRAKLRDEWLSRSDVSAELEDAYIQEVALRALIQFHNNRKYSTDDMQDLYGDLDGFTLN